MTKVFKDKKTCFETVADAQVYFSRDIKENDAAKEFGGMSWEEMREYTTEDNHLYEIIKEINDSVWPFISVYHNFDVVGHFYGEFLKYTGGDKKH